MKEEKGRLYWLLFNIRKGLFSSIKGTVKKWPVLSIIVLLLLAYFLFTGRGFIQPLILGIRKYIVLLVLIALVLRHYLRLLKKSNWKRGVVLSVVTSAFVLLCWFTGPSIYRYLSLFVHYTRLEKVALATMPESGFERIQPFNSIKTLINQEALSETEDATFPRFVRMKNGNYAFSSCIGPSEEYKIQQLNKNQYEIISVPAQMPSPVFTRDHRTEVSFNIGELLLFSHQVEYAVIKRFNFWQYLNYEPSDPVFIQNNLGKWVQVVPLIKWTGLFFPRPVFGGAVLIGEAESNVSFFYRLLLGAGQMVSIDSIAAHSFLKGQNLMPKRVVDFIAESFRFSAGFLAPMPGYHEGDIRIPALPQDQSPQPFVTYFNLRAEGKVYNYYGLEPYQREKKGLSLSLFIAGDSDKTVFYIDHRNTGETFIGSSAVPAKIIESKKNYDWSENYPAESRPFVRNVEGHARLFWLSTIVTRAGKGKGEYIGGSIPEICLTDAIYGKVVWINQDSLINQEAWIRQVSSEMQEFWHSAH